MVTIWQCVAIAAGSFVIGAVFGGQMVYQAAMAAIREHLRRDAR